LAPTAVADRLAELTYWAHMSLRLVDRSIRHHTAADVDRWLATAALRMD
jgi:hypothetical protein